MMSHLLTTALGLAFALPALAQPPARPRDADEVTNLRERVRELEAKLKNEERKTELKVEVQGDKPEIKKQEPQGGPMGGGFGSGGFGGDNNRMPGSGGGGFGFNPVGGIARMPGFEKLSKEEQATFAGLVEKMRAAPVKKPAEGVEARLERLEKAIEELKGMMRGPIPGGPGGPGGGGPGRGGPGGGAGAPGGRGDR